MEFLTQLYIQIRDNVNTDDYESIFYLSLAARYLGIDAGISNVDANETEKNYYYLLLSGIDREFEELYKEGGSIQELLYACDCSDESAEKIELLKQIDIFDYVEEEDFAVLLNLYVISMIENALMTESLSAMIIEYIEQSACEYGYTQNDGAYDFRTSVYDTNILYLLNGGEDIGLR